jgi:RimJ/RimL family protein N-acetyltransferase
VAVDTIRTARLLLRRARGEDLDDMHAVLSRPEAMRYWSTPAHETKRQTRDWLRRMIEAPIAETDDFVVERDGRVIGKAGAWKLPEVGFILHPDHWRQGLTHEAMTAVIAHLFDTRDLAALTADTDPRNAASIGLLKRLGFRQTGHAFRTMQWGDEWCDSLYFALERARAGER